MKSPTSMGSSAVLANSEALSAAMVNGSQMHGLRAMCVMKSVGLHVATDALAIGNLAGAHPEGGVVVVMGDDPWSDSTQVPADSRFLCTHIYMPILEPTTNQEMKDWVDLAFRLSRESELYRLSGDDEPGRWRWVGSSRAQSFPPGQHA